jgi:hypothetical protein
MYSSLADSGGEFVLSNLSTALRPLLYWNHQGILLQRPAVRPRCNVGAQIWEDNFNCNCSQAFVSTPDVEGPSRELAAFSIHSMLYVAEESLQIEHKLAMCMVDICQPELCQSGQRRRH